MSRTRTAAAALEVVDRPIYGTKKHRASDIAVDDVIRNKFGKWDVVLAVDKTGERYVDIQTEVGGPMQLRRVHLVDVQFAKPS